jgi:hypothetical protein
MGETITIPIDDMMVPASVAAETIRRKQRECHAEIQKLKGSGKVTQIRTWATVAGLLASLADALDATEGATS